MVRLLMSLPSRCCTVLLSPYLPFSLLVMCHLHHCQGLPSSRPMQGHHIRAFDGFRSPRNKCNCTSGMQPSSKVVCKLRCGGGTVGDDISQRRHSTSSLSMTQPDSSGGEVVVVVKNNAKYHLIWSAGFWKKMTISTILLLILQSALKRSTYALELIALPLHACHGRILPSVILPLLSSSCCAIQLIINALSGWGCAGFNAYLGPIRPILLSVLLLSTWKLLHQRSLGWTTLSLVLAFLPEIVDVWNTIRSRLWQEKQHIDSNIGNVEKATTSLPLPMTAKIRLNISTMGCVACVNKVDTSIRKSKSSANIREETSWLTNGSKKGGFAELLVSGKSKEEIDGIAEEVVAAVKTAGFQCNVETLKMISDGE